MAFISMSSSVSCMRKPWRLDAGHPRKTERGVTQMKSFRTILLVAMLLTAGSAFAAQVSVGIRIGPPPRPRVVRVLPQRPGADFVWVDGYWYPVGKKYSWHAGYWTRPPYQGARWVEPHHDGQQFFAGYWDGDHGRMDHDHHSDHDRIRDFRDGDQNRH
jgi:WXXGXW repeat (2 copies)